MHTLVILFLLLLPALSEGREFYVREPLHGPMDYDAYLDELGLDDLELKQICYPVGLGLTMCNPFEMLDKEGRTLVRGGFVASEFYKARYRHRTLGVVLRRNILGRISNALLVDSLGRTWRVTVPGGFERSYLIFPLKDGSVLYVGPGFIATASVDGNVLKHFRIPGDARLPVVGYNVDGTVCVGLIRGNDILLHNLRRSFLIKGAIRYYSDRRGVLSVYPESEEVVYVAIYRYVNPFLKGPYLYRVNMELGSVESEGFVFTSSKRNVGFDLEVYKREDGELVVSARDSTEDREVHFLLVKEDLKRLVREGDIPPEYLFERNLELHLSAYTGVYYLSGALSPPDIEGMEDVTYRAGATPFYGVFLSGRSGNYQLAVSYLREWLREELGRDEAAEVLVGVVNINRFIKPYWSLRVGYERVRFTAQIEQPSYASDTQRVKVSYNTFYAKVIMERGIYLGGEYVRSTGPGLFTFSSGVIRTDLLLDERASLEALLLVVGYDSLAYARRYETNISGPYLSGKVGYGVGRVRLSEDLIRRAEALGYRVDRNYVDLQMALRAEAEVGFLIQRRWVSLKGGGLALNLGYRVSYSVFSDRSPYSSRDDRIELYQTEGLYERFGREDLVHGPFLQLSVIF